MAQPVVVNIYDRYFATAAGHVFGPVTVAAGQSLTFTATGWPWKSAFRPDRQYYAIFSAVVHVKKKGKVPAHDELMELKTHEFCKCTKPSNNPTTTSSSTSTSTSTTTMSTSTTTTTIHT